MDNFQRVAKKIAIGHQMFARWKEEERKVSTMVEKCRQHGCITRAQSDEIADSTLTEAQRFQRLVMLLGKKKNGWRAIVQLLRDSPTEDEIWKVTDAENQFPGAEGKPILKQNSVRITDTLLGCGGFGKVFLCYPQESDQPMAVKQVCIDLSRSEKDKEAAQLANEITLMSQLKHDRIVRYFGCQKEGNTMCIYMEYMPGGSLLDEIRTLMREQKTLDESKKQFDPIHVRSLKVSPICTAATSSIETSKVKSANILKDSLGNVKIGDFGTSRRLENLFIGNGLNSHLGTPYYMAPEVIHGGGYGRKADIWSFGCTLLEMLTGHHPWHHLTPMAAIFAIGDGEDPLANLSPTINPDFAALLKVLFTRKPFERPTADEAISHAALKQH